MKTLILLILLSQFFGSNTQFDTQLQIANDYRKSSMLDSASYVLDEIDINKLSSEQKAMFYFIRAEISYKESQLPKALKYYLESLTHAEHSNDLIIQHNVNKNIGGVLYYYNSHNSSIEFYKKALSIANSDDKTGRLNYNLALSYYELENYPKAISLLDKAYNLVETENWRARIDGFRGRAYNKMEAFENAEYYFRKAIKSGNKSTKRSAYHNLALCKRDQGEIEEAEAYFLKALEIAPDNFITHLQLGIMTQDIERLKLAEELYANPSQKLRQRNIDVYRQLARVTNDTHYWERYTEEMDKYLAEKSDTEKLLREEHVNFIVSSHQTQSTLKASSVFWNNLFNGSVVTFLFLLLLAMGTAKKRFKHQIKRELKQIFNSHDKAIWNKIVAREKQLKEMEANIKN